MHDERLWLTLRLTRDEMDAWTRLARDKGYSRSELVRLVLREIGHDYAEALAPRERASVA